MQPFAYEAVTTAGAAVEAGARGRAGSTLQSPAQFLAGGTTLIDLMKLDVMRPEHVIDINPLASSILGRIDIADRGIRLGALVRMAEAADHPQIRRAAPAIAQSLNLAASGQIRNMASLGGNVLQRTRCPYFRDVSYSQCNKRSPGSGCAALDGFNRSHAVLGTSDRCIATYPGDFAQALIALDATVEIAGPRGTRSIPFADLHRPPGTTPDVESTLEMGDIITAFFLPARPFSRRSLFLKVRDRESYEFALASAVVALDLADGKVQDARIALGGVASVPWRATDAEAALKGKAIDEASKQAAAEVAFRGAKTHEHNAFKVELGKRTLMRAIGQAAAMEI
jgi:xanthine dehydrogenase YagS FAD-binding subunit